jgi:hypothetical protein
VAGFLFGILEFPEGKQSIAPGWFRYRAKPPMSAAEASPAATISLIQICVVSPRKDGANGKACATTATAEAAFLANVVQMPSREKKTARLA